MREKKEEEKVFKCMQKYAKLCKSIQNNKYKDQKFQLITKLI